ncbi:MAG: hypothetical protein WBL68_14210 [Nitrososphaeraceae archaeon]
MTSSHNDSSLTNPSSDASLTQGYSPESSIPATISKYDITPYTRILVPHDGKETSEKHLVTQYVYQSI